MQDIYMSMYKYTYTSISTYINNHIYIYVCMCFHACKRPGPWQTDSVPCLALLGKLG